MKYTTWGLTCVALVAATLGAGWIGLLPWPLNYFSPESRFIRYWRQTLEKCPDASSADRALSANKEGGDVVHLADGTWVAVVMEHECCTGAGFNATLYVTSTKEAYLDSRTGYCGFFPLREELLSAEKRSIPDFLNSRKGEGKQLSRL